MITERLSTHEETNPPIYEYWRCSGASVADGVAHLGGAQTFSSRDAWEGYWRFLTRESPMSVDHGPTTSVVHPVRLIGIAGTSARRPTIGRIMLEPVCESNAN
jgi:hypothetical protein